MNTSILAGLALGLLASGCKMSSPGSTPHSADSTAAGLNDAAAAGPCLPFDALTRNATSADRDAYDHLVDPASLGAKDQATVAVIGVRNMFADRMQFVTFTAAEAAAGGKKTQPFQDALGILCLHPGYYVHLSDASDSVHLSFAATDGSLATSKNSEMQSLKGSATITVSQQP